MNITPIKQKIITKITDAKEITAKELEIYLGISRQALFKHLKELIHGGFITKQGSVPKVFYSIKQSEISLNRDIDTKYVQFLNDNFLTLTPDGRYLEGVEGFVYWCNKRKENINKTAGEYIATLQKYFAYKNSLSLIDGTEKMVKTFGNVSCVDAMFYSDFYSIERFGKTKLGQMVLYAKQAQNRELIHKVFMEVENDIVQIIKMEKIEALVFVPPTVKREVQIQKEFLSFAQKYNLPFVELVKTYNQIPVAQKTLNKLEDRIENASNTIFVKNVERKYNKVLVIDDAVGSGATINQIACKLKNLGVANEVVGYSVVGSFKGFDVISEV